MCDRPTLALATAGLVTFLVLGGCAGPPPVDTSPRPVRVMRVNDAAVFSRGFLPGRAKATQEVNLSFRVSGPLVELPINVGDDVKTDDVIAQIDPRDFQVAYRAAEADLAASKAQLKAMEVGARPEELAQLRAAVDAAEARARTAANDFARAEQLITSRTISQSDYDLYREANERGRAELLQAREELRIGELGARAEDKEAKQAEIKSLEAALLAARNQLLDTRLVAKFDGTIVARYVDNFQDVQSGQPIVRILDTSKIEMVVNVPESGISLVPHVTDIVCTFDAFPDHALPAKVKEVGQEASEATRTYPVNLIMDQPEDVRILPGMAGRVTCRVEVPETLAEAGVEIPESAVLARDGKRYVWTVDSADGETGTVHLREISGGELSARGLRQVGGLATGEWLVTAGVDYLSEGQTVRLLDQKLPEAQP